MHTIRPSGLISTCYVNQYGDLMLIEKIFETMFRKCFNGTQKYYKIIYLKYLKPSDKININISKYWFNVSCLLSHFFHSKKYEYWEINGRDYQTSFYKYLVNSQYGQNIVQYFTIWIFYCMWILYFSLCTEENWLESKVIMQQYQHYNFAVAI